MERKIEPLKPKIQLSERLIPETERITYTWSKINAHCSVFQSFKDRICKLCKKGSTKKKQILIDGFKIYGVARPGEILAIMGSSGSGKTTLLNTLTYQSPSNVKISGFRRFNGVPVSKKTLTHYSAYVQQEDLFIGTLTVKEHLIFNAMLRMGRHFTNKERLDRVNQIISELSLTKCEDSKIGITGRVKGISGGEKKRLAFATELLREPKVMFADEPLSGLDSYMALNVVQIMRGMAQGGKTMICTVHQPSSELYSMFDKIFLMAEGRMVFAGTPKEAETFFNELNAPCPRNYNPADFYIQILAVVPEMEEDCRKNIFYIREKYQASKLGLETFNQANFEVNKPGVFRIGSDKIKFYNAPYCKQFRALFWRSWLSTIRDPLVIKIRFIQSIMIALLIGLTYYNQKLDQEGVMNINGVIYVILNAMTFQNVSGVANIFCDEIVIFLREHTNHLYRTNVYFLCKTLTEIPIFIITTLMFTSICYYMVGLNSDYRRFCVASGVVVLIALIAAGFGYVVSCASPNVNVALALGVPMVIPFMLFGGFFLHIDSIPIFFKWLSYLSWFRYGNEVLMSNQWHGIKNITCPAFYPICITDGDAVLRSFNFSHENVKRDIGILVSLSIGFKIVAYFILLIRSNCCK